MTWVTQGALVAAGILHLLPVVGLLGAAQLQRLYGIDGLDANLSILMRHRAALFGILGTLMVVAAFTPHLQIAALCCGFASVAAFLWLAGSVGGYNGPISRVVLADWVALVLLVAGGVAKLADRGVQA